MAYRSSMACPTVELSNSSVMPGSPSTSRIAMEGSAGIDLMRCTRPSSAPSEPSRNAPVTTNKVTPPSVASNIAASTLTLPGAIPSLLES
eukprot:364974-Chlamydomonas_euryale.AAC.15